VQSDHRTFAVLLENHLSYYFHVIKALINCWTWLWLDFFCFVSLLPVSYYSWLFSRRSLSFRL